MNTCLTLLKLPGSIALSFLLFGSQALAMHRPLDSEARGAAIVRLETTIRQKQPSRQPASKVETKECPEVAGKKDVPKKGSCS